MGLWSLWYVKINESDLWSGFLYLLMGLWRTVFIMAWLIWVCAMFTYTVDMWKCRSMNCWWVYWLDLYEYELWMGLWSPCCWFIVWTVQHVNLLNGFGLLWVYGLLWVHAKLWECMTKPVYSCSMLTLFYGFGLLLLCGLWGCCLLIGLLLLWYLSTTKNLSGLSTRAYSQQSTTHA